MQEEQETVGTKPYQFIILKAFKMVTRQALKNAIYCQALYWSHETTGNVPI